MRGDLGNTQLTYLINIAPYLITNYILQFSGKYNSFVLSSNKLAKYDSF